MISYVYWNQETSTYKLTCINIVTLTGTLIGQVAFGYLGDRNGRKKMYGVELLLLIVSTLGVVMSSEGHDQSMSIFGWLLWWRLLVGIGVGADCQSLRQCHFSKYANESQDPLSAVITAEFAPTRHRARMMAYVGFPSLISHRFNH
jgi:MFS transporter, PHS family, inorganic phosphate transporter